MTSRLVFRFSILALVVYSAVTQECPAGVSEKSILGWMLQGHIYDTLVAELPHTCFFACHEDDRCQSFNWVISLLMCEFNNRTKEARPEDFKPNPDRFYFQRFLKRVPLGSIPELPAETCDEIKRSEEQAASGKYWFSTIKTGTSVLAYCNMETKDIDECSGSSPVCDVNANCSNTRGSYICTCKSGYTGDGKTCQDIDECTDGSHHCDKDRATCTNTIGSYKCVCKAGYDGDGKTCIAPECRNYSSLLGQGNRKTTYITSDGAYSPCDKSLFGWHRFEGVTGTKMPTSCVVKERCATDAPGWLNGTHPTVADGLVTRRVCFSYFVCCSWSIHIQVRNCGDFFIYNFTGTPSEHPCHLRYCSTD